MTNIPRDNNLFRVLTGLETKKQYQGRRNLELTQDIEEASGSGLTAGDVDNLIDAHKFGAVSSLQYTLAQYHNQNIFATPNQYRPPGHYNGTMAATVLAANTIIIMPVVVALPTFMIGIKLRIATAAGVIATGLADSSGLVVAKTPSPYTTATTGYTNYPFAAGFGGYSAKPGTYYMIIQTSSGTLSMFGVGSNNYMGACSNTTNGGLTVPALGDTIAVPGSTQTTSAFTPFVLTY